MKTPPPSAAAKRGRPSLYNFAEIQIGGFAEMKIPRGSTPKRTALRIRNAGATWRQRTKAQISFVVRWRDADGTSFLNSKGQRVVRVWGVEPLARGGYPKTMANRVYFE